MIRILLSIGAALCVVAAWPAWAQIAVAGIRPNTVVRGLVGPEVYWINAAGQRQWIRSMEVYNGCALPAAPILLADFLVSSTPRAADLSSPAECLSTVWAGRAAKGAGDEVYLLVGRQKLHITQYDVFLQCGFTPQDIVAVPQAGLATVPTGPALVTAQSCQQARAGRLPPTASPPGGAPGVSLPPTTGPATCQLGPQAKCAGANLAGRDLRQQNLSGIDLRGANLTGVNLAGAQLQGANLAGANATTAVFAAANLSSAVLEGINLAGADLSEAVLSNVTLAAAADLRKAKLDRIQFSSWAHADYLRMIVNMRDPHPSRADLQARIERERAVAQAFPNEAAAGGHFAFQVCIPLMHLLAYSPGPPPIADSSTWSKDCMEKELAAYRLRFGKTDFAKEWTELQARYAQIPDELCTQQGAHYIKRGALNQGVEAMNYVTQCRERQGKLYRIPEHLQAYLEDGEVHRRISALSASRGAVPQAKGNEVWLGPDALATFYQPARAAITQRLSHPEINGLVQRFSNQVGSLTYVRYTIILGETLPAGSARVTNVNCLLNFPEFAPGVKMFLRSASDGAVMSIDGRPLERNPVSTYPGYFVAPGTSYDLNIGRAVWTISIVRTTGPLNTGVVLAENIGQNNVVELRQKPGTWDPFVRQPYCELIKRSPRPDVIQEHSRFNLVRDDWRP